MSLGGKVAKRVEQERKIMRERYPWFEETENGWRGYIVAPDDSIYAGANFLVEIEIIPAFPIKPPLVKWWTPIWHPNVSIGGSPPYEVCIGRLGSGWKPSYSIADVIDALIEMLRRPNPLSALNEEAAHELLYDNDRYRINVYNWLSLISHE